MTGAWWWAAGGALVVSAALAAGLLARFGVPRLPEPADEPPAAKIRYADLATPRFVAGCVLAAGLAATVSWLGAAYAHQPLWWVLATVGTVLAAIDARTTWLPLTLTRLAWAAMAAAGVLALVLGAGWPALLRAAGGAALAGLLFWLVWRLSRGGFGFGDVRFAPLVGAASALDSWSALVLGLFASSVLGAGYGVARRLRGRPGAFPYAPALLAGAYLGCAVSIVG